MANVGLKILLLQCVYGVGALSLRNSFARRNRAPEFSEGWQETLSKEKFERKSCEGRASAFLQPDDHQNAEQPPGEHLDFSILEEMLQLAATVNFLVHNYIRDLEQSRLRDLERVEEKITRNFRVNREMR